MSKGTSIFDGGDRTWIRDCLRPRYPELVKPYLEASRLYRSSKKRGNVSAHALATLILHASSPRTPLGENAAAMLGELYDVDKSVERAIRELAAGRSLHQRINALIALASCDTNELHEELLADALEDRSARVRALAADKIVNRGMRGLLQKLIAASQRETNTELKDELLADINYLTQGYHVRQQGGNVWATCRIGGMSTGAWFSKAEFETEGRAWIKATLAGAA